MNFNDLVMTIFALIGLYVLVAFAVNGIIGVYGKLKRGGHTKTTLDDHFNTTIR